MEPRLSSQNIQVQLCMLIHVYVKEANVIIADILVTYTLQENDSLILLYIYISAVIHCGSSACKERV